MDKAAKDNSQTSVVDGQSYVNKVVHQKYSENKRNKVKSQDKILAKVNGQSSKLKIVLD